MKVQGVALLVLCVGCGEKHAQPSSNSAALASTEYPAPRTAAPQPPPLAAGSVPKLLRHPALSRTLIAFDFAGEIWTVPREGGEARRLVTGQLRNSQPVFSPDGSQIAFTGVYENNPDVYVVPAVGGEPRRLTHHPDMDIPVGWTPDGKKILFASMRATARDLPKLFTVPATGGPPEPLPLPSGFDGSYSPEGKRLAYMPIFQWQPGWKKYRGGQATPIWIADLADSKIVKIPREGSNDRYPTWSGDKVFFVSDREGAAALYSYDVASGQVKLAAKDPDGFEVRSASAGPGAIAYETLGAIHLYDLSSGTTRDVPITITADLPQVRPHFARIEPMEILHATPSPSGKRVLIEAHGEILSVPAEKGDVRNLTRTPAFADRDPAWSPDGKSIAWLSDESGEYALYVRAPDGYGPVKKIDLGQPPSYFYQPRWSPDSKKIAVSDKRLNLWLIDLAKPTPKKIDHNRFEGDNFDPTWSPDSRFLAYAKQQPNYLHAIVVYSLDDGKTHQITDGRSDAASPRFDKNGKLLWFLASTDIGTSTGGGQMTSMGRTRTSALYAVVLDKKTPSPFAPESDEEGSPDKKPPEKKPSEKAGDKAGEKTPPKPTATKVDFDGIDQRIVAAGIDRANYADIQTAGEGVVFLLQAPIAFADEDYEDFNPMNPPPLGVFRFDLKDRKATPFIERIDGGGGDGSLVTFSVTADGSKVLFVQQHSWFLAASDKPPKPGEGMVKAAGSEVWVDPRAEWRQMYHEVWRIERDFLYDPHAHGLDLAATERTYAPYLAGIASRDDLNALLEEALSNLVLGHVWSGGGAMPKQDRVGVGLLGADYKVEQGRYRFAKILSGENWNPRLRAPLTQPGVDVKAGDFLLAVNGQDLRGDDDIDRLFLGTAMKQTTLTVGPSADGKGSHPVVVVPVPHEGALRLRAWMDDNRKKVEELSKGRVGYVYVPDTAGGGFTNFNRYYFSQVGKDAVVIDERFNHGGYIADYIVNVLGWKPLMGAANREGEDQVLPTSIYGPKVMIANEMSGSGGDALPWMFKRAKIGPLVGKRTWGGLVGIGGYPQLIDGGRVTAPRWALYGVNGEWEVENHGIAPDIEVEQDPALIRQGHDPQLERAVQLALDELEKSPVAKLKRPSYPDYGARLPHPSRTAGAVASP
jgi:tricorn protease